MSRRVHCSKYRSIPFCPSQSLFHSLSLNRSNVADIMAHILNFIKKNVFFFFKCRSLPASALHLIATAYIGHDIRCNFYLSGSEECISFGQDSWLTELQCHDSCWKAPLRLLLNHHNHIYGDTCPLNQNAAAAPLTIILFFFFFFCLLCLPLPRSHQIRMCSSLSGASISHSLSTNGTANPAEAIPHDLWDL